MTSTPVPQHPEPERRQRTQQPARESTKPARTMPAAGPRAVLQLQSAVGNAAVASLLAGRGVGIQRLEAGPGGCPPPPVAPPGTMPAQDPKFAALKGDIAGKAKTAAAHPPAASEVTKAQDAAVAPPDDKEAQAKAAQAEKMEGAKPGGFDKAKFIVAVTKAIEAQRPTTNEEAKEFSNSGKAGQIKSQVAGMVSQGKQDSAKDIAEKTGQAPDPSVAKDKPVTPLPPADPVPQLPPPDAKKAIPDKAPAAQMELGATKCELNAKMAEANVTEEQLAKSNEPEFTAAVEAKKGAEQHAVTGPPAARAEEATQLNAATGQADAAGKSGVAAMLGARTTATGQTEAAKSGAKAADEKERARITTEIKRIFDATKGDVDKTLGELDGKVAAKFDAGERDARAAFEADHKRRMAEYEDRIGLAQWLIDKFRPTQPDVLKIFVDAAATYEKQMRVVISDVADLIGTELDKAKDRITKGRAEVAKFVAEQPKALQGVAKEAAQQIGSQFDSLDSAVDAKQDALVDDLASKYVAAREDVDKRVKELQEENKSWRDKAVDAVGGAIETILKLKEMLLGVLARAAGAVENIIKDPIGFLGKFVSAVKTGVMNFGANILQHLKKGLQGWLFGALAEAGIEIPDKFDLKGIVQLILSLLGLTWNAIRARITKVIPEPVMKVIETSVDFVKAILSEGVVGLWKWIVAKLSDLKEMVMGQIREFVVTKIITAGITWLISILNPAAAFIKACKMIYDAVMWFVDNAARLKDFVDSVLDSVASIASGGVGAVAGYIEQTLAKTVPMVISGLASLLGLGGIADKIKKVLETIQKPVMSVVDKLVGTAVKFGKNLLGKFKKKDKRSPAERKAALDAAMAEGQTALKDKSLDEKGIRAKLASIKGSRKVKKLDLAVDAKTAASETVHIVGANSPTVHGPIVTRTHMSVVQRADEDKEVTASSPPITITVEGQDIGVWKVDDKTIRITFDELAAKMNPGATPARALQDIMAGLKMDRDEAKALLDALAAKGVFKTSAEARVLLHAYARTKKAGGQDPVEFLRDKLQRGAGTAAAFSRPPGYTRRQAGVELGQTGEGEQRATLSNFAQVFYEKEVGQWTSRQVQPRPEQGENTSIEYVWTKEGTAVVESLGIIEVDESGTVVDIVEVARKNVPGGKPKLAEIMKAAGWRVELRPK